MAESLGLSLNALIALEEDPDSILKQAPIIVLAIEMMRISRTVTLHLTYLSLQETLGLIEIIFFKKIIIKKFFNFFSLSQLN
jgi:DNA-binding XRE family transcriptional regulator